MNVSSVLRSGPLRALVAAQVISTTGSQMTWVALPWFVLTTSGSATRMSFVVAAEVIGMGLLTLPGSRLLGGLGARRTMMICDAARAPLIVLIPLLNWANALSFPLLLAIAFAIGALTAPSFAAQKVMLPELFGEDEHLVTEANALTQAASRASLLLGPVVAGVLISLIGAPAVLLVDGASYVVSFLLVALFVPRRPPIEAPEEGRSVKTAVRFLVREPLLRIWGPALAIGDMAWTAFFVAVPVLVVARFDSNPRIVGWLFASFGLGALLGNAISYRVARRIEGTQLIATFILGQALAVVAPDAPAPGDGVRGRACGLGDRERNRQPAVARDDDAPDSARAAPDGAADDDADLDDPAADRAVRRRAGAGHLRHRAGDDRVRRHSDPDDGPRRSGLPLGAPARGRDARAGWFDVAGRGEATREGGHTATHVWCYFPFFTVNLRASELLLPRMSVAVTTRS